MREVYRELMCGYQQEEFARSRTVMPARIGGIPRGMVQTPDQKHRMCSIRIITTARRPVLIDKCPYSGTIKLGIKCLTLKKKELRRRRNKSEVQMKPELIYVRC